MKKKILLSLILLCSVMGVFAYPSVSPYAYCNWQPTRMVDPDGKFAIPIHKEITQQALEKSTLIYKTWSESRFSLMKGISFADRLGFAADLHFDNRANYSAVQARWNTLNQDISKTIGNIGLGNKLLGGSDVVKLGLLLHNVQDFYAHSNYADLYIEYYKGVNNGAMPTSLPTYDEGIQNPDFNKLLQEKLRTGEFNLFDNEKFDINPFRERANEPTSHNMMNKDNANTPAGKLAKQAAIRHTTKILNTIE